MYRKTAATLVILGFASTAGAQSVLECSRLDSEAERLECYDRVAGRVEEKLEEKPSGTTEERVEARNEALAEAVLGDESANPEVPDIYTVTIKNVQLDRNRRPIYTTDDGRYFRRSSSSRVTFRAGDVCTIKEGMMGSKHLIREDGQKNKVEELNIK